MLLVDSHANAARPNHQMHPIQADLNLATSASLASLRGTAASLSRTLSAASRRHVLVRFSD